MFRRRTSNEASQFDAGSEIPATGRSAGSQSSRGGRITSQTDVSIAAIRQQSAKRRAGDAAGGSMPPATVDNTVNSAAEQLAAAPRARVSGRLQNMPQQQVPQVASLHNNQRGDQQCSNDNTSAAQQAPDDYHSVTASNHTAASAADQPLPAGTRLPATLEQHQEQSRENNLLVHECVPDSKITTARAEDTADGGEAAVASITVLKQQLLQQQVQQQQQQRHQAAHEQLTTSPASLINPAAKHSSPLITGFKTLRFEVQPADLCGDSNLIDYDGHDQSLPGAADGSTQHYIYHEATGQLCRVGQGADSGRSAHHYLEDWNTGEFFQLAQPSIGCFTWLRRKPHAAPPPDWSSSREEPSALRSLADFTDSMGSAMAALGLFAQGLAGGLALLCLFMAYLQYAVHGRDGFLAYYSSHAQMVNRAYFTLISLSMVAAASRLAYDSLGRYQPQHLKLKVVDVLVLVLYLVAYTTNLLATPTDDRLTYEAVRDLQYWRLALPPAFVHKLGIWQVLNLFRVVCCGLAWCLVCYRSNPYVMMAVFQARELQQAEEGGTGLVLGLATPPAAITDPAATPAPVAVCSTDSATASPVRTMPHQPGLAAVSSVTGITAGTLLDAAGYTTTAGGNGSLALAGPYGHAVAGWTGPPTPVAEGVVMANYNNGTAGRGLQQQQQQHLGTMSPLRQPGVGGIGSGRLAPGVVSAVGVYGHHSPAGTSTVGSPSRLGLATYSD